MLPGRCSPAVGATVVVEAGACLLGRFWRDHVTEIDGPRGVLQTLRAQMPCQGSAKQPAVSRTDQENGAHERAELIDGRLIGKRFYARGRKGMPRRELTHR